jgi:hypothetical protein
LFRYWRVKKKNPFFFCHVVIQDIKIFFYSGGFMLIRSPNGTFEFIDFRETAPQAATEDMYVHDPTLAKVGALSVAVP